MSMVTKKKRYHRPQLRRGPSVEEGTQTSTEGVESDVGGTSSSRFTNSF